MRAQRAYVLPLVLVMTSVLAIAAVTLYLSLSGSAAVSRRLIQRKAAFHATDGMMRAVLKEANAFLRTSAVSDPVASTAALQAHFTPARLTPITPAGYVVEGFAISSEGLQNGVVPNGAFAGMNARLFPVKATVKTRKPAADSAAAEVTTSVVLAQIAAFQFFLFGEGYVDWFPAPTAASRGRSHVNGNFCLGGVNNFALERVTASEGIFHIRDDTNCRMTFSDRRNLKIAVGGTCSDFPTTDELDLIAPTSSDINSGAGFTCTLRELPTTQDHNSAGWAAFAQTQFVGNVLDSEHGISELKLPVTGTPLIQAGFHAGVRDATTANAARTDNLDNLRMLVDPLLPASRNEPLDVMKQKMMFKADLRIINGVWYLRDPAHPEQVGKPIWSDHPGSMRGWSPDNGFAAAGDDGDNGIRGPGAVGAGIDDDDVGQVDLASRLGWTTAPTLYSYYETGLADQRVLDNNSGIISYGTLFRAGAGVYHPGYRSVVGGDRWCNPGAVSIGTPLTTTMRSALAPPCAGTSRAGALLHSTRSGIKDGHAVSHALVLDGSQASPTAAGAALANLANPAREDRARLLPINFDVAAFQAALESLDEGELGDVFRDRPPPHDVFNGIVYITSTWPGANKAASYTALGNTHADAWPIQGNNGAPPPPAQERREEMLLGGVPPAGTNRFDAQVALPWSLCGTTGAGGAAGAAFDANNIFQVPDCADAATRNARPNAVRVINGAVINPTTTTTVGAVTVSSGRPLARGLSIVTNLPILVQGDLNTTSNATTATSLPWTPVMIAGDALYHLSNAWDDKNSPWGGVLPEIDLAGLGRVASNTTYNAAYITGWTPTAPTGGVHSGGIQNITRYLEDWGDGTRTQNLNASFLVGFSSVHTRTTVAFKQSAFRAPNRNWAFDLHFESLDNQPPGAPEFNISSTRGWQRK